ncbi:DUF397 domain-containing protein [Streptomyces sp. CWNU-52B]|uniref:DUF397 domain-containing protein n=1 Tax=unclassified Streptomyces TaxID=2593676 RepID=UPI0039C33939
MKIARSAPEVPSSWFKSSYSNGAGGECVECARMDDRLHVRDSKRTGGPVVVVRSGAWAVFIRALEGRALTE